MHTEEDTKALLLQIAEGDEKAFRQLFDLNRNRLYVYINRLVKSRQVAEEIVMDVFMKIWLGRTVLPEIEHFDGFLFRIAFNKSLDFLRRAARDPVLHDLLWDRIEQPAALQADALLLEEEYKSQVRRAVGLLPPQRGRIFRMSRFEGLSHEEIASRLRLSRHTVNNHIVEAKHFIRNYLADKPELGLFLLFFLLR
jgi:RNA polymerase sigma-70 factor (ECF subfamily)